MELDLENDKVIMEKDGVEINCDILFTFDSDDTKKSYVGYTDNEIAANGRKTIYVSSYDPSKENIELEDITDKKELDMIQDVLRQIDSETTGN